MYVWFGLKDAFHRMDFFQRRENVSFFLGQEADITERFEAKKLASIDLNQLRITTCLGIYYKPNINL